MKTALLKGSLVVALSMSMLPSLALADHNERREVRQDVQARRDDWRDEHQVRELQADFFRARRFRSFAAIAEIDRRLDFMLREEMVENLREYDRARAEVGHDHRELNRDFREARPGAYREDRKEARDDWRDLAQERRTVRELQELRARLNSVRGRMYGYALATRQNIISQLLDISHREQLQNRQELREDRHELRQDFDHQARR